MKEYDVLILGAGLSGLTSALLLAKEGKRVGVLEAHHKPGGYLQTFRRAGAVFEVGFHYMGSMDKERPLAKYFRYLGIYEDLPLRFFSEEGFYEVHLGKKTFCFPTHFKALIQKLLKIFPRERKGILSLEEMVESIAANFAWYDLQANRNAYGQKDLPNLTLQDWLRENIQDPWLQKILGIFSFQTAESPENLSFWKYAMVFYSIFDSPVWLKGGGDALIQALYQKACKLGAEFHFSAKATRLECENQRVKRVYTEDESTYEASWILSSIHPKNTISLLDEQSLKPLFKKNILDLEESKGSLILYLILEKELMQVQPIHHLFYAPPNPYYDAFYFMPLSLLEKDPVHPRAIAISFVDAAPFLPYRGTKVGSRPQPYLDLKAQYVESFRKDVVAMIPELDGNIRRIYASTPLTNEDYTGSWNGSVFGIRHNPAQEGMHRANVRTRIKNLLLAGQSIHLPGICGTLLNAFYTSSLILGEEALFSKISGSRY